MESLSSPVEPLPGQWMQLRPPQIRRSQDCFQWKGWVKHLPNIFKHCWTPFFFAVLMCFSQLSKLSSVLSCYFRLFPSIFSQDDASQKKKIPRRSCHAHFDPQFPPWPSCCDPRSLPGHGETQWTSHDFDGMNPWGKKDQKWWPWKFQIHHKMVAIWTFRFIIP